MNTYLLNKNDMNNVFHRFRITVSYGLKLGIFGLTLTQQFRVDSLEPALSAVQG